MKRTLVTGILWAAGVAMLAGTVPFLAANPSPTSAAKTDSVRPVWVEIKWPFPIDQWGTGKAYVCRVADCGSDISLYLRVKAGSCDCSRGVEDDVELERISDMKLIGNRYRASGPGQPITVASMKGRSRPYAMTSSSSSAGTVLTIAFHDRCDMVVATAVVGIDRAARSERVIMHFLNSDVALRWLEQTLGL
jgi:hypothetical protein